MSTRSIIAVTDPGFGWVGVYHHSDGYPSGMGVYLSRVFTEVFQSDIAAFRAEVIDRHTSGWSHLYPHAPMGHYESGIAENRPQKCGLPYARCQIECAVSKCYCTDSTPALYYGTDLRKGIDTDAAYLYVMTPDGITISNFKYMQKNPLARRDWRKRVDQTWYSVADAIKAEESEESLAAFRAGTLWAMSAPMPTFSLHKSFR